MLASKIEWHHTVAITAGVQSLARKFAQRSSFLEEREKAIFMQSLWQQLMAKEELDNKRKAALSIQSLKRAQITRSDFLFLTKGGSVDLQALLRMSVLRGEFL